MKNDPSLDTLCRVGGVTLPLTALVQLTFSRLNSYFVARREQGVDRLASEEQFTPYVDTQIQGRVVKDRSMEIVLYDHIQGRFHVKSRSGRIHHLNLNDKKCTCGKTLIYGFPRSQIIAACQHRCVDFRLFVQCYYTTQSYYDTWASLFYDHIQSRFHVKSSSGRIHHLNLNDKKCTCGKTLIYGFPRSLIIAACQHRCVDFRLFVQGYHTTQSYYNTWASLFYLIFNEDEWPLYDGPTIVAPESMKRQTSGRPISTWLHNEMDVREGKTTIKCGLCKQTGHNRRSCKNRNQVQ